MNEAERQAVACGFGDPISLEQMEALRSAPSSGLLVPMETDLTSLKRLLRRLHRQGDPRD